GTVPLCSTSGSTSRTLRTSTASSWPIAGPIMLRGPSACPAIRASLGRMTTILELADRMWAGEADLVHEHHPVTYRHPQAEEIAEGVQVYIGIASANAIDTGDVLVML